MACVTVCGVCLGCGVLVVWVCVVLMCLNVCGGCGDCVVCVVFVQYVSFCGIWMRCVSVCVCVVDVMCVTVRSCGM